MKRLFLAITALLALTTNGQWPPERAFPENYPSLRVGDSIHMPFLKSPTDTVVHIQAPGSDKVSYIPKRLFNQAIRDSIEENQKIDSVQQRFTFSGPKNSTNTSHTPAGSLLNINDTLVNVFRYAPNGGHVDSSGRIVIRYSYDKGLTWTSFSTVYQNFGTDDRNVQIGYINNTLYAWFRRLDVAADTFDVGYIYSSDLGQTWSNYFVYDTDGNVPSTINGKNSTDSTYMTVYKKGVAKLLSSPNGIDWQDSYNIYDFGSDTAYYEPSIEIIGDTIVCLLRNDQNTDSAGVLQTISFDLGETWTTPVNTNFTKGLNNTNPSGIYYDDELKRLIASTGSRISNDFSIWNYTAKPSEIVNNPKQWSLISKLPLQWPKSYGYPYIAKIDTNKYLILYTERSLSTTSNETATLFQFDIDYNSSDKLNKIGVSRYPFTNYIYNEYTGNIDAYESPNNINYNALGEVRNITGTKYQIVSDDTVGVQVIDQNGNNIFKVFESGYTYVKSGQDDKQLSTHGFVDTNYYRLSDTLRGAAILRNLKSSKTTLLPEQNLFEHSINFNDSYWDKNNTSINGGIFDPFGDTLAYRITENLSLDFHALAPATHPSLKSNAEYTVSVFLKPVSRKYNIIRTRADGGNLFTTVFNLETGVIESGNSYSDVEKYPNGWYRLSQTFTNGSGAPSFLTAPVVMSDDGSYSAYQGNGSSGYYIYGAQIAEGSEPGTFIETENNALTSNKSSLNSKSSLQFKFNDTTASELSSIGQMGGYYTCDTSSVPAVNLKSGVLCEQPTDKRIYIYDGDTWVVMGAINDDNLSTILGLNTMPNVGGNANQIFGRDNMLLDTSGFRNMITGRANLNNCVGCKDNHLVAFNLAPLATDVDNSIFMGRGIGLLADTIFQSGFLGDSGIQDATESYNSFGLGDRNFRNVKYLFSSFHIGNGGNSNSFLDSAIYSTWLIGDLDFSEYNKTSQTLSENEVIIGDQEGNVVFWKEKSGEVSFYDTNKTKTFILKKSGGHQFTGNAIDANGVELTSDQFLTSDGTQMNATDYGLQTLTDSDNSTSNDIQITDGSKGIIFKTPDGTACYRLTIDNSGTLQTTLITCP